MRLSIFGFVKLVGRELCNINDEEFGNRSAEWTKKKKKVEERVNFLYHFKNLF